MLSRMKLIHKITITFILTIILPIVIVTSIAYFQFYNREKDSLVRSHQSILNLSGEQLDYVFTVTDNISKSIRRDQRLLNYLTSGGLETYYSPDEFSNTVSPIFEYSLMMQMVRFHSCRIYSMDSRLPESDHRFRHIDRLANESWYQNFISSQNTTLWLGPQSMDALEGNVNDKRKVYSFCRKIISTDGDLAGLLVISISESELYNSFADFYQDSNTFHIMDRNNEVLYSSDLSHPESSHATNRITLDFAQLTPDIGQPGYHSLFHDGAIFTFAPIDELDLYLGVSSPMESPLLVSRQLIVILLLATLCLFVVVFYFYRYISKIFRLINHKIEKVNDIIHDDFNERLPIERTDEIGAISKSFNVLLDKINALIKDVINKETAQKDANLKALQYQINPHFIYNTIEIFSTKMELAGEYETSDALASFGKMLRYNLNSDSSYTTIGEELGHVESYLLIEKLKYDNLTFSIHYSKELHSLKIIKFILQPIVENCFTHGFDRTQDNMIIDINIIAQEGHVHFSITDNGTGLNPDYCQTLNEVFRTSNYDHPDLKESKGTGIGLRNINERLKLFYNPNCYIAFSRINHHTMVSFRLPLA